MFCSPRAVLARGTPVTSKSLKIDDSNGPPPKRSKKRACSTIRLIEEIQEEARRTRCAADPISETAGSQADAASDASAGGSTSEGESDLGVGDSGVAVCGGGGLTCFGYYWSNMRRVAPW